MGPVFDSTHPWLAINGQASLSGAIKQSRSKKWPRSNFDPGRGFVGVSTAGIYVTTPCCIASYIAVLCDGNIQCSYILTVKFLRLGYLTVLLHSVSLS